MLAYNLFSREVYRTPKYSVPCLILGEKESEKVIPCAPYIRYADTVRITKTKKDNVRIVKDHEESDDTNWLCYLTTKSAYPESHGYIRAQPDSTFTVVESAVSELDDGYTYESALVIVEPYSTFAMMYSSGNCSFLHFTPTQVIKFTKENAIAFLGVNEYSVDASWHKVRLDYE